MQYLMDLYHTSSTELVLLFVMLVSLIPVIFLIKRLIFIPVKNYLTRHHYDDYERIKISYISLFITYFISTLLYMLGKYFSSYFF